MRLLVLPAILILTLALGTTAALLAILRVPARTKALLVVAALAWFVATGLLAWSGFFSDFSAMPPRLLIALLGPAIALALAWRTDGLRDAMVSTPVAALLYLQVFRVLVELLLFRGYKLGTIPVQMTFAGRNFDILAGLTAPIAGWIWQRTRSRIFATLWNFGGLVLLGNIVVVALLSMPAKFRIFTEGPPNTLLTHFPFIYLPAALVPIAYTVHILSLRQIWAKAKAP